MDSKPKKLGLQKVQRCSARPIWGGWACWAPQKNRGGNSSVHRQRHQHHQAKKSSSPKTPITNPSHSSSASARILSSCGYCGYRGCAAILGCFVSEQSNAVVKLEPGHLSSNAQFDPKCHHLKHRNTEHPRHRTCYILLKSASFTIPTIKSLLNGRCCTARRTSFLIHRLTRRQPFVDFPGSPY